MNNQELSALIAEEVSKAVAPLYERLDLIEASTKQEIPTPEEPFNFRACYERTGRIEKQK